MPQDGEQITLESVQKLLLRPVRITRDDIVVIAADVRRRVPYEAPVVWSLERDRREGRGEVGAEAGVGRQRKVLLQAEHDVAGAERDAPLAAVVIGIPGAGVPIVCRVPADRDGLADEKGVFGGGRADAETTRTGAAF